MGPLQWMGAVRMRVQTADKKYHKNPQVSHMYMKEWRKLEVSESIQIKSQ